MQKASIAFLLAFVVAGAAAAGGIGATPTQELATNAGHAEFYYAVDCAPYIQASLGGVVPVGTVTGTGAALGIRADGGCFLYAMNAPNPDLLWVTSIDAPNRAFCIIDISGADAGTFAAYGLVYLPMYADFTTYIPDYARSSSTLGTVSATGRVARTAATVISTASEVGTRFSCAFIGSTTALTLSPSAVMRVSIWR